MIVFPTYTIFTAKTTTNASFVNNKIMLSINPNRHITSGYIRGSMIDATGAFRLVPLDFIDYLNNKMNKISQENNIEYEELIRNELIIVDNLSQKKQIWSDYSKIAHVSINISDIKNIHELLIICNELFCRTLTLLISDKFDLRELPTLIRQLKVVNCRVSIVIGVLFLSKELMQKINETANLTEIYAEKIVPSSINDSITSLEKLFITKDSKLFDNCHIEFFPHPYLTLESISFNTYLNKRIHIDDFGRVFRYKNDLEDFGSINNIGDELIDNSNFQKYWNVTKDKIDVCKFCEFKHVCTDFRIPKEREPNEWYNIDDCIYNPFIGKWSHEKGYYSLKECGIVSNKNQFSINHERIAKINKELW